MRKPLRGGDLRERLLRPVSDCWRSSLRQSSPLSEAERCLQDMCAGETDFQALRFLERFPDAALASHFHQPTIGYDEVSLPRLERKFRLRTSTHSRPSTLESRHAFAEGKLKLPNSNWNCSAVASTLLRSEQQVRQKQPNFPPACLL